MSRLDFIHRFVPAEEGESQRVLLLLHGTGGDENDLLPLGRELDPHAALLSPRGRVLENGMPRFFRRLAEGVFDEEDVIRRASELADFITAIFAESRFHPADVTAVGYSNGANIAAAMLLLRPEVLSVAVLLRAMVPLSEPPAADLTGKQVLISSGQHDPIIPPKTRSSSPHCSATAAHKLTCRSSRPATASCRRICRWRSAGSACSRRLHATRLNAPAPARWPAS